MQKPITINSRGCAACPTIFELTFPDGTLGYLKFRYGYISLYKESDDKDIIKPPIRSEQISDSLDGVLELNQAIEWLESNGYNVAVDDFVYKQIAIDFEL